MQAREKMAREPRLRKDRLFAALKKVGFSVVERDPKASPD